MSNRFAILNLDEDSDVEKQVTVKKTHDSKNNKIECRVCREEHWSKDCPKKEQGEKKEVRKWDLNKTPVEGRRDWNLKKDETVFRPFSKDKVFQQPHPKKNKHPYHHSRQQRYMFQEDDTTIPLENVKPPTPEEQQEKLNNQTIQVPELLQLKESTLADKIKKALEKQEYEKEAIYRDISGASYTSLKMNRVISK